METTKRKIFTNAAMLAMTTTVAAAGKILDPTIIQI